jgi:TPR repeat protein
MYNRLSSRKESFMVVTRAMGISLFLAAFAIHTANAEDYESIVHKADATEQKIYEAATNGRSPAAMYAIGVMFDEGLGQPIDESQAFRWYKLAAGYGHAEAMNRIGNMYAQARGVPHDYVAALEWYRRAVAHGSLSAVTNLATLYFYGLAIPQNYMKAANLLRSAVRRGDPAAANKLGGMYESGFGVARNVSRARSLYLQAAAQRYTPAMVNLGLLYIEAVSVRRDDVQGYALVAAAVEIGVPDDMTRIASDELSEASGRLDQHQLAKARVLARGLVGNVSHDVKGKIE